MIARHRWWSCLWLAAACVGLGTAAPGAENQPITFGPHPRLTVLPADSNEVARAIASAEPLLKDGLHVLTQPAQWVFYYACPKDGARLTPETPEKHLCPVCKTVYTDARTVAAYRFLLNEELNGQCLTLAVAYGLTHDEKYAQPVRQALLELARLYPTFERHDRWGRTGLLAAVGGRRYAQQLDEAFGILKLAQAYDLVAPARCFTDADRRTVEQDFLAATVREVHRFETFGEPLSNHQTWFNTAYAMVGVAIGDADLVNLGVHGGHGLLWQLDHSVTSDGLWYEGTMSYQFYTLSAIQQMLDAVKHIGWDFAGNHPLKSLWLGPIQMAYPDGRLPAIHDSDPSSLAGYAGFYKWAAHYFQEPQFARYAGLTGPNTPAPVPLQSAALKGIGVVALRRGAGERAVCALMDYGIHGGAHGHPDKLNLMLYALGNEFLLDPGRISYSVPEYKTWCRTTAAHNTVVVDGHDQQPTTGELWYFTNSAPAAAALCASAGAYPGYLLKRFLVLTDTLLADVYCVTGERAAQLDWFCHCRGTLQPATDLARVNTPLGDQNGYQHLTSLSRAPGAAARVFIFAPGTGKPLRIHLVGDEASDIYTGLGIGSRLTEQVPFLLRRRTDSTTVFITIYDLSGDGSEVKEIKRLPVLEDGRALSPMDAVGLQIAGAGSTLRLGLDLRRQPSAKTTLDGQPFERLLVTTAAH